MQWAPDVSRARDGGEVSKPSNPTQPSELTEPAESTQPPELTEPAKPTHTSEPAEPGGRRRWGWGTSWGSGKNKVCPSAILRKKWWILYFDLEFSFKV